MTEIRSSYCLLQRRIPFADNVSTERKKRICSSITITRNYRGWIALDTLLAVKLWDKPNRNFGIAVDVQDQDDNPLPAARYFQPTDCSEASKANGKCVSFALFIHFNSFTFSLFEEYSKNVQCSTRVQGLPQTNS